MSLPIDLIERAMAALTKTGGEGGIANDLGILGRLRAGADTEHPGLFWDAKMGGRPRELFEDNLDAGNYPDMVGTPMGDGPFPVQYGNTNNHPEIQELLDMRTRQKAEAEQRRKGLMGPENYARDKWGMPEQGPDPFQLPTPEMDFSGFPGEQINPFDSNEAASMFGQSQELPPPHETLGRQVYPGGAPPDKRNFMKALVQEHGIEPSAVAKTAWGVDDPIVKALLISLLGGGSIAGMQESPPA